MSAPQPPGSTPPPARPPDPVAPPPAREPEDDTPSTWQPGLYIKLILVGLAIAYVVAFVVENTHRVKVDFVFTDENVHLIWVMLILVGLGLLLGVLLSQLYRHRRRAQHLRKQGNTGSDLRRRDEAERKPG